MIVPAVAKLAPPRLGRAFERARLFAALDEHADSAALWIGAAPGAGKSTLVATWLRSRRLRTLWLQLDEGDADPATFMHSLDAVFARTADAADAALQLPAFRADDLSDLRGWLRRRVRLHLAQLPPPWVLVFDNHQELGADSALQVALAQALEELPSGVQWVFVSREPPPPAFTLALARRQMAILDASSLRLDDDETLELVRLHGQPPSMAAALRVADGWAGGMTLMLQGGASAARPPELQARDRLMDYFAGEVLDLMPAAQQRALCAMSTMPSLTAQQAIELSALDSAGDLLERLASRSLFTDRREGEASGDDASPRYVFHALFAAFLRRRAERVLTAPEQGALLRRAGELLALDGQVDAALQRFAQAHAWDDASRLLARHAPHWFVGGRTAALRQHIDALPLAQRDALAYWRGVSVLDTDPDASLADLERAYAMAVAAGDALAALLAASSAAVALVSCNRVVALDRWLDVLDQHHDVAAEAGDEDTELRVVPGLLAAVVYRRPWHALAPALADRAERLLHRESAPGQRLLLGSLALHLLWSGQLERLGRIVQRVDALGAQQLAAPATRMRWWSVGVLVKTLLGQHDAARVDAERALALAAAEPSVAPQRSYAELLRMIIDLACADAESARRHLESAEAALDPANAVDRATCEHQRGMLALLENDRPTALRLMRASVVSARRGGFPMREHLALIANALAAAHAGEHDEARALLGAVFAHPFYAVCRWHHWVAGTVAAYAALARGDEPDAVVQLRRALGAARDCGFRHGPMLFCCGDMMSRLVVLALAHGIEPDVARDIVRRNHLVAPADALADWPWALRLRALGDFEVEVDGAPLRAGRKESRRLLELLRLLVAHGDAPLPLDQAADALWPDADGDAARNALDNALHRLRKMLGGDDRIALRHGALVLDAGHGWSDVRALDRVLAAMPGAGADALPGLARALRALYRGPLLPGDETAAVVARRGLIHQRVLRALGSAADRLRAGGAHEPAAAVDATRESLPDL